MLLAGDIGGTKTHLALFDGSKNRIREEKFPSQENESLEGIVDQFLQGEKVNKACFGIAGPVVDNVATTTNLPWKIDPKNFSIENVKLLNDLEANAYGLFELPKSEFLSINKGVERKGNQVLVSAGTGLGEAGIFFDGEKLTPFACEGGHADFAPTSDLQVKLYTFLQKEFGRVSYERILSGPGLHNLYQFMKLENGEDPKVEKAKEKERPKIISQSSSATCTKSVELFASIYGQEAGNCALKFMSFGGVFIGGGIAPKIQKQIQGSAFIDGFTGKGRVGKLVSEIPVTLVLQPETALLGAMHYVHERM